MGQPAGGRRTAADRVPRTPRALGLLAVIAATLSFAISLSVVKWPRIPGSVIAWWRLIGSSLLWWAFLVVRRQRTGRSLPTLAAWRLSTPPALCFGINISLFFLALTRTSVAHADFISSMSPLLLIPAGFVFFGEQPRWRALRWGGLSAVGLVIILWAGSDTGVATVGGDVLVVAGVIGFAGYQLLAKRARGRGVEPFDFMAIVMTVALVTATPVAVTTAGRELWPLSAKAWIAVGILSVMTGMVGHGLLYYAHKSVPIATISLLQTGQPTMSTFWAWVLLGETITIGQVPGMALVTTGVGLAVWSSYRLAPPARN
jgi:drug/metabolite transporter (DMT)-like permease